MQEVVEVYGPNRSSFRVKTGEKLHEALPNALINIQGPDGELSNLSAHLHIFNLNFTGHGALFGLALRIGRMAPNQTIIFTGRAAPLSAEEQLDLELLKEAQPGLRHNPAGRSWPATLNWAINSLNELGQRIDASYQGGFTTGDARWDALRLAMMRGFPGPDRTQKPEETNEKKDE